MRPPPVSAGRVEEADGVRPLPPVVVPELNRWPSGMQRCPDTTTLCAAWHRQSEHPGLPHPPPPRPKVVPVYLLGHPYGKVIHSGWGRHWKDQIRQRLGVPESISIGIKRGKVFCCLLPKDPPAVGHKVKVESAPLQPPNEVKHLPTPQVRGKD